MDAFSDRFVAATYDNEQPDEVRVAGTLGEAVAVPAFVFPRLLGVGHAYGLHYLGGVIRFDEENRLDLVQCQQLVTEIEFVAEVVRDPLLLDAIGPLLLMVERVARSPRDTNLIIELES